MMAAIAVALRFIPYSERSGDLNAGWAILMGALLVVGVGASVWAIYVLEILKFRRFRAFQMRRADPDTAEHEIDEQVERELETGEFRSDRLLIVGVPALAQRCGALVPFPAT